MSAQPRQAAGWAVYPLAAATPALLLAVTGLFWDVAYHIEHGRDVNLLTPAHVMILAGLLGLGIAALGSVLLATRARLPEAWRLGPLRIPPAALPLGLMAGGAVCAFPLDDLWHRTYGIDVTLWSPTHLVMIGGGVLSTFALCLYLPHAGRPPGGRLLAWRRLSLHGAILVGLSVFLLEYDFGLPQWRAVYHPLLLAVTAALGLVAARVSLGRGGALRAVLFFLGLRLLLAGFVRLVGHNPPATPLMLPEALLVEAAFLLEARIGAARASLLAGVLVAVPGLAVEWLWTQVAYPLPWQPSLLPWMWLPALGAVAGAVAGLGFGSAVARRASGLPAALPLASVAGIGLLLAIPLSSDSSPSTAALATSPAGQPRPVHDRFGEAATEQDLQLDVWLRPAGAAAQPDWFVVEAWQGGGHRVIRLRQLEPGHYRASEPVPTGGSWKSMLLLARGPVVSGAPISFPPDPEYRQAGVEPSEASVQFRPAASLMLSESHGGPPYVAAAAYTALVLAAALWMAAVGAAAAATTGAVRQPRRPSLA